MKLLLAVTVSVLLAGCNLFEPFRAPGDSDNVEDLISDSRDLMGKGDYRGAFIVMEKAMGIAPNDPRVRYYHAVTAVGAHGIDMLDVLDILQPVDDEYPVDAGGERVLLMTGAELKDLFAAFYIVSSDLKPLVGAMLSTGRELSSLRESEDVFLSFGVSETILGMLRVLDNDDSEDQFTLDERFIITKRPDAYELTIEDILLTPLEQDRIVDEAIERAWEHFLWGRHALYCYYQYVTNEMVWTETLAPPPAALPVPLVSNAAGDMARYVDAGVLALYIEKEDLEQ